jgi:hypothetical protein
MLPDFSATSFRSCEEKPMIETQPTVQDLKEEIDDLRRQREYLNKEGSQPELQRTLMVQIERVQKRLKELHGVQY